MISTVEIPLDQFEAMRLCDIDGLDQAEAGEVMGISRGTVQRLLYQGRKQLLDGILGNSAIIISLKKSEEDSVSMYTNKQRRRVGRCHS